MLFVQLCIDKCASFGYPYSGTQNGTQVSYGDADGSKVDSVAGSDLGAITVFRVSHFTRIDGPLENESRCVPLINFRPRSNPLGMLIYSHQATFSVVVGLPQATL